MNVQARSNARLSGKRPLVRPIKRRNLNPPKTRTTIWEVTDARNGSALNGCGGCGCGCGCGCYRRAPLRK